MNKLDFDQLMLDIDNYIGYIKSNKRFVTDAVSALNILWLGELLDKNRKEIELSDDAMTLIEFRHHFSHVRPETIKNLQRKLDEALSVIDATDNAKSLVKGELSVYKKKPKEKNIRFLKDEEIINGLKNTKLGLLDELCCRIINAPAGNRFNLERNYIILPDSVTATVAEEELKSIIYDAFGSHAVLRLVKNINQTTIEKESHGSIAIMVDGSVKIAFLVDARTGKQINFKNVKTIKKIQ